MENGRVLEPFPALAALRERVLEQLASRKS
jgi:hypothetical protein